MGVYGLELVMDPVQPASCTLTLVQDIGSFAAGICATTTAHTQTNEIV
jgi:hypothetical protein